MQYVTGDSHYVDPSVIAHNIEAFNEQVRECGYDGYEDDYSQREANYVGDVQSGDYTSDYKRIQIANAIERINAKIAYMKPSADGRVLAPGEEAQGFTVDTAPSGSDAYREYYIKEMSKRVIKEAEVVDAQPESIHQRSSRRRKSAKTHQNGHI
jgi:hypothetical protein